MKFTYPKAGYTGCVPLCPVYSLLLIPVDFVLSFLFYLPPKHVSQPFFSGQVVVELERANSAGSESDLGQLYICTTHAHYLLFHSSKCFSIQTAS